MSDPGYMVVTMNTATDGARVEVTRCSLADLIDLSQRAADTLRYTDSILADALHCSVTQVQVETYLAG